MCVRGLPANNRYRRLLLARQRGAADQQAALAGRPARRPSDRIPADDAAWLPGNADNERQTSSHATPGLPSLMPAADVVD